ncbi:MAG: BlaI/MecI/CopY family transcriptional regulator [Actinomycetota bacterium]|nr:BlaI/MecI/CopY family transcriptional regulator [Actinomycetota bacterium]
MKKFKLSSFRPSESGIRKVLGDLEADIMEQVWQRDVTSVREVYEALKQARDIAYTTVMTVMVRLSEKGILKKEREGKHYLYRPTVSREELSKTMLSSIINGFKADFGSQALAFFIEELSEDEQTLDELEALIREKRKQARE